MVTGGQWPWEKAGFFERTEKIGDLDFDRPKRSNQARLIGRGETVFVYQKETGQRARAIVERGPFDVKGWYPLASVLPHCGEWLIVNMEGRTVVVADSLVYFEEN